MPSAPFLPIRHPVTEAGQLALMTEPWQAWARQLQGIVVGLNVIPGVNLKTLAELNALGLGAGDAGYLAWETAYGHSLRWTGSVWQFAPGDPGSGWWALRPVAPQEVGWQLCDGTVTDYLTVGGATLTVTAHTTPNVTAGTFLKVLAAYTGTIEAAIAAAVSGSTATVGVSGGAGDMNIVPLGAATAGFNNAVDLTSAFEHLHTVGTLATNTAARPPSLGGLLFFRR